MLERFKDAFNKIDFDTETRGIDAYEYHYVLRYLLLANGIFFKNRWSKVRLIWPLICLTTCLIGWILMFFSMYHTLDIKDIPEFSEDFSYTVIILVTFVQQTYVVKTTNEVHQLVKLIDNDFKEMDNSSKSRRKTFFDNQLLIWKMVIGWLIFGFTVLVCFALKTIIEILYQELIQEYNEGRRRPLAFKVWLPYINENATPTYELLLLLNYIAMFMVFSIFGTYLALLIQFIMHTIGQFDLILLSFRELYVFDDNEKDLIDIDTYNRIVEDRFSDIVQRHQRIFDFCDRISNIMGPTLINQMTLTAIELCLTAFQVADSIENGKFNFLFFLLFSGSLIQLYIPCSLGSMITERASQAGDACYSSRWESTYLSTSMARNLQIFIQRCNISLKFSAIGVITISLETFSSVVSTAGSYFTMLRQINDAV